MYPGSLSFISSLAELMNSIADSAFAEAILKALTSVFSAYKAIILLRTNLQLYRIWLALLQAILFMEQIFDVFTGTSAVYVKNSGGVLSGDRDFLTAVFSGSMVQNAYFYLMIAAFALCFFFTIIAVIRSMGESISEVRRPVTAVLRSSFEACLTFLLVPAACLAALKAVSALLLAVRDIAPYSDMRISDVIFTMGVGDNFISEESREICSHGQYFTNGFSTMKHVRVSGIMYLPVLIMTIFMVVIMSVLVLQAIMRAMTLVSLFVASPFFVSTIPLDGGEKFKGWVRLFAGFTLGGFGPIFILRFFSYILPMLASGGGISFGNNMGTLMDWVTRILLICGGVYAAWKSQYVVMEIISPEAVSLLSKSAVLAQAGKQAAMKAVEAGADYVTGGVYSMGKQAASTAKSAASGGEGSGGNSGGQGFGGSGGPGGGSGGIPGGFGG